jgi:hypothetical protein
LAGADEDAGATGDLDVADDLEIIGMGLHSEDTVIDGGGIDRVLHVPPGSGARVHLTNLTLSNGVTEWGGGLAIESGLVTVERCTVRGNTATGASDFAGGGGIVLSESELILDRSLVHGNEASAGIGGGIYVFLNGDAKIVNSTISGNHSNHAAAGILTIAGRTELEYATIVDNVAGSGAGGLLVTYGGGGSMRGSLIARNVGPAGPSDCYEDTGAWVSQGFNLLGTSDDCSALLHPQDLTGTSSNPLDPLLGNLANNGGETRTHRPLPGSAAIDGAELSAPSAGCPSTDQRAARRGQDGDGDQSAFCDVGAVEVHACEDGLDNDGDGVADHPGDLGCEAPTDASERGAVDVCDDGLDNDGDGLADYPTDLGCSSPTDGNERGDTACDNEVDDDGDGLSDFPNDPGCDSATDASERSALLPCDDGLDNDDDGMVDYLDDFGCESSEDESEGSGGLPCDDGVDNDGDGFVDWLDPGCTQIFDLSEHEVTLPCDNSLDDDGNGLIDLADPECTSLSDPTEGPDMDGDGVTDIQDNCLAEANGHLAGPNDQFDSDNDLFGNACDCDFDQSDSCNIQDFNLFLADFQSTIDSGVGTDMNGDGSVGIDDFNLFLRGFVTGVPGPSGLVP